MVKRLSILLLLIGCSTGFKPETKTIAPELLVHVQAFEQIYGIEVKTPVYFADLDGNAVGMCRMWSNGKTEIIIDIPYYKKFENNYYAIEEVMFHELGHCVLKRQHNEEMMSPYIPKSIMYPYVFGDEWYYVSYRDLYLEELHSTWGEIQMVVPYLEFID
jgi:hypothetical protein